MAEKIVFPKREIFNETSPNRQRSGSPILERFDVELAENPDARASVIRVISSFTCAEFTAKGLDGATPLRYASDSSVLDRLAQWNHNLEQPKPTAAYVLCCEDGIKQPIVGIASFLNSPSKIPVRLRRFVPESGTRLYTGWFNAEELQKANGISTEEFAYKSVVTALKIAKKAGLEGLDMLLVPEFPIDDSALTIVEHKADPEALKKLGFKQKGRISVPIEGNKYEGELQRLIFN